MLFAALSMKTAQHMAPLGASRSGAQRRTRATYRRQRADYERKEHKLRGVRASGALGRKSAGRREEKMRNKCAYRNAAPRIAVTTPRRTSSGIVRSARHGHFAAWRITASKNAAREARTRGGESTIKANSTLDARKRVAGRVGRKQSYQKGGGEHLVTAGET